ncbi:MAG: omptin family outer membrane protease [Treponema sp.]|nr:omptin family outer membrane protease [Treponema sp.]
MKNITVLTFLVIILFFISHRAYAQDRDYNFSFDAQFGFIYGQSMEIVYPTDTAGKLLSELIWDIKPVLYLGFQVDYSRTDILSAPGFFASLKFNIGIPGDSGIMEDRDWRSTKNDALTNYSCHTNKTNNFFALDLLSGVSLPVNSIIYMKYFLSGGWTHFSFTARDGYYIYANYSMGDYKPISESSPVPVWGDLINYSQDWLFFGFGFTIGHNIITPLFIDFTFRMSPFTFCIATDEHLRTSYTYRDLPGFALLLEPKCTISFVTEYINICIDVSYRYISISSGDSYFKSGSSDYKLSDNAAGAGLSFFDVKFFFRYTF